MRKIVSRIVLSVAVATLVTFFFASIADAAGPYTINENTLYSAGGYYPPIQIYNPGCAGNYCRYLVQDSYPDTWRWAYTKPNMYQLWVYRPLVGQAAAKYWWLTYRYGTTKDSWFVTVDQSKNKGTWAYLGFADYVPNDKGELRLSEACVPGYWCGGLKVYWDNMKYNTRP